MERDKDNRTRTLRDFIESYPCDLGCDEESTPELVEYCRRHFPCRPYCIVSDWIWIDLETGDSLLYASKIVKDEAARLHIQRSVLTSPLVEFERNCVFATRNTAYILSGPGRRAPLLWIDLQLAIADASGLLDPP
jgi:hypothetical protein